MDGSGDLTPRQRRILAFVRLYRNRNGRPPTLREVTAGCGLAAQSAAAYHVGRLEAEGYLLRERRIARGLRLTERGERAALAAATRRGSDEAESRG